MFNIKKVAGPGNSSEIVPMFSISDDEANMEGEKYGNQLPVVALKNTVLFPGVIIPISIAWNWNNKASQYLNFNYYVCLKKMIIAEPFLNQKV